MRLRMDDVDVLRNYVRNIIERAGHDALKVNRVAAMLEGAVIWRKDHEPLEIMAQEGFNHEVLCFKVSGKAYVLFYDHHASHLELRRGTTQGAVIAAFTNATPLIDVRTIFGDL